MPTAPPGSVGRHGENDAVAVYAVQKALAQAAGATLDARLDPGKVDGRAGDGTRGAIEHLQRAYLHTARPDGRVDAGGRTAQALACLVALGEADWLFPFDESPSRPYHGPGAGMRSFRWSRSRGKRSHAGADLYRPYGTPVRAVADGTVVDVSYFYLGTYAVTVAHPYPCGSVGTPASYTVRYGEVAPGPPVEVGQDVKRGDVVGKVGKLKGMSLRMLHAELFLGTVGGNLTQKGRTAVDRLNNRPFYRRRDLCDPTGFLARAPLA